MLLDKFFKNYFILFFLLIFLLSTCTVYAEDIDDTTLDESQDSSIKFIDDSYTVSEYENKDLLGKTYQLNSGKFSDIQNIIDKAKNGNTIKLTGTFKSNGNQITINKKLTITSSNGAILDGKEKSRIFYIKQGADGTKINNLIIKNGFNEKRGGGVYITSNKVSVNNCTFINNYAHNGGALSTPDNTSYASNLNIKYCNFYNNYADSTAGAVGAFGLNTIITNCIFDSNQVIITELGYCGGALQVGAENIDNNCQIISSIFRNNGVISFNDDSKGHAGVACLRRGVEFNSCIFENNYAYKGGVLTFHDGGSVINCNFTNNTSERAGVILTDENNNQIVNIKDCNFNLNFANRGGVLYLSAGTTNIFNSKFSNNEAYNGGTIYVNSVNTEIRDCEFENNLADYGGVLFTDKGHIGVFNSNFINSIGESGGVIYSRNSDIKIHNSNFKNNYANVGGTLQIIDSITEIYKSSFENNTSLLGESLIISNNSNVFINNSYFINNSALNGSAIYNMGILNIFNSTFNENQAKSYNITSSNNAPIKKGEDLIIQVTLLVGDNVVDAIYNHGNIAINNNKPKESNFAINQEILLILNNDTYIVNTNDNGTAKFVIDTSDLDANNFTYFFIYLETTLYTNIHDNTTIEILENPSDSSNFKKELLSSSNDNNVVKPKKKNSTKKSF